MSTAPSAPPANIGKYRIERELGRGASGIVFLGLDGFRGRKVAIKQTHAYLLKQPDQADRYRKLLRNEAALSGRLRHPNIVRLLDADEDAFPPYLVLEYIDGQALCKDAPVKLDFNSIAAGHAVDLIAARLQAMGVANFVAEATGELKAAGRKPDGSPWRIALELPREDRQIARQIIPVNGLSVSTSGDYRHYFEENGRRYSHTFDARLGRPVQHDLAAVTVLDASALQADGYSTLLLILGPERGWDFAVAHGLAAVLVTRAEGGFVSRATPAFERAVKGE